MEIRTPGCFLVVDADVVLNWKADHGYCSVYHHGGKKSQSISYQFIGGFGSSRLSVKHPSLLFSFSFCVSLLTFLSFGSVQLSKTSLSPLLLLTGRAVKVNVCDRRVIRVFLSSKTMLHRESRQIKELYLAALTWNRSISSANSTSPEERGGSPLKQHPQSPCY